MDQSFIRQDTNIVCSNMTISSPRKLGLDPQKELIEFAGISICGKKRVPLLNISDKKLNDCFKCKMPKKIWGGLAAFFIGIAIVALVVLIVLTAEISIPIIAAISTAATISGLIGITIGSGVVITGAAIITVYKLDHDCDKTLEGRWINYHETALIETMPALLNKSELKCPIGGTLDIILDDELANAAAKFIADTNDIEIWIQWGNKFISGVITFIGCGGGEIGILISSGFEIYETVNNSGRSNETHNIWDDAAKATINQAASSELELFFTLALEITCKTVSDLSWKSIGKNVGKGFFYGFVIFLLDQTAQAIEARYEQEVAETLENINEQDQEDGNNIGIIATTQ